ncbi:LOW QUALITY PROTEIN: ephrin-B2 [Podarcis muralis]
MRRAGPAASPSPGGFIEAAKDAPTGDLGVPTLFSRALAGLRSGPWGGGGGGRLSFQLGIAAPPPPCRRPGARRTEPAGRAPSLPGICWWLWLLLLGGGIVDAAFACLVVVVVVLVVVVFLRGVGEPLGQDPAAAAAPPTMVARRGGSPFGRCCWGIWVLLCRTVLASSLVLEPIYWNSSNSKFHPGQGLVLYPKIGDKLDIICPKVDSKTSGQYEYYKVYMVDKDQADSCTIKKDNTPLLNCAKPDQDVKFTIKFQEFSPNLWGLEFQRNKDYYIISTSNGSLEGLDNQEGGVCQTKAMKILMKVGQVPNSGGSPNNADPTKRPEQEAGTNGKSSTTSPFVKDHAGPNSDGSKAGHSSILGSEVALFAGIASGSIIFLIIIITLVVLLLKYRRRHRKHSPQHTTTLSLSTLATPKRSGNNNGSEPSDIIIPLRTADSVFCPHYEKVSGDYGHPVYIVQEMPPQSPANIYYKV